MEKVDSADRLGGLCGVHTPVYREAITADIITVAVIKVLKVR
jgi:hypothetical protein